MLFISLNYLIYPFVCIKLIPQMLIWVMFDCKYKLEQVGSSLSKLVQIGRSKKEEVQVLDMIQAPRSQSRGLYPLQSTDISSINSITQTLKNPGDQIVIQAESGKNSRKIFNENLGAQTQSRRLDLHEINFPRGPFVF